MSDALLDRLAAAVEKVLERNRRLTKECRLLTEEKAAWQREKSELLADVERILSRLDGLELEDT